MKLHSYFFRGVLLNLCDLYVQQIDIVILCKNIGKHGENNEKIDRKCLFTHQKI